MLVLKTNSDCRNPFDLKNSGRIFKSKFELLYRLIPEDVIPVKNYIFTGAKNICVGDVQIDDLVSNLNPNIKVKILFPSYHNKKVSDEKLKKLGIIRAGYDYLPESQRWVIGIAYWDDDKDYNFI